MSSRPSDLAAVSRLASRTGDGDRGRDTTVVLGVIGNDIHVVGNRILHLGLTELGYEPHNLGTNNDLDDFAEAARRIDATAVLIGSLNGEAELWCDGARSRFDAAGCRGDLLLYLGGNLAVGDQPVTAVEQRLLAHGFDRVFHRPGSFHAVFAALSKDLGRG